VAPDGKGNQLVSLLQLLRECPCLLVLDNFETVLEPGQPEAKYREGLAGYGAMLQALAQTNHQSCIVITSREVPPELAVDQYGHWRSAASGFRKAERCWPINSSGVKDGDWNALIARYAGQC
jgi:hypothetical protein